MKRFYAMFVIVIPFLLQGNAQTINWTLVNTGTNKNIRDISFINKDTGFIAGDDGLLKMTTNGGTTWSDMTIPSTGQGIGNNNNIKVAQFYEYGGPIAGVLFFDKFIAINRTYDLSGGWSEECGGSVFSNYDSVCSINNFHHAASYEEYVAGSACSGLGGQEGWFGGFCFTFDSLMPSPFFSGWNDVTAAINRNVIMVGPMGYYAYKNVILGQFTVNSTSAEYFSSVDWSDTTVVYAANQGSWPLYFSTDGGLSFEIDSTVLLSFSYESINEIDFTDNSWGVMAGLANTDHGVIMTKMGNTNNYFYVDTPMTSVFVIDSTLAFAGGLNGELYKYDKSQGTGIGPGIESINFSLFPNPQNAENDILHLFVEETVNEITIYDMLGKVLLDKKINKQGKIDVNTGIKNAGTYIVRIVTDKGVGTRKYVLN